jgi:hypothetical protein
MFNLSADSVSDPGSPTTSYIDAEPGPDHQLNVEDSHAGGSKSPGLLSEDPFSSEASQRLFNAIDELRQCGAGQDLDLPQVYLQTML